MQDTNVETGARGCLCILHQFSVIGTVFPFILAVSNVFMSIFCDFCKVLKTILCPEMLGYNVLHGGWCAEIVFYFNRPSLVAVSLKYVVYVYFTCTVGHIIHM